jgi:hypothetical protein
MAIIDQQIQSFSTVITDSSNSIITLQPRCVRGSNGTLYALYIRESNNHLYFSYSTDSGLTWTDVDSGSVVYSAAFAIDSSEVLHVAYTKRTAGTVNFKKITSFVWGSEETLSASGSDPDIAIDSSDIPHVVYTDNSSAGVGYQNRVGGTWSVVTALTPSGSGDGSPKIAIDSNNYRYVVFQNGSTSKVSYVKYTFFWTTQVVLGSTSIGSSYPHLVIDSSDNVHVIWPRSTHVLAYSKYTASTDSWSAEAVVTTSVDVYRPSIAIDSSNVLTVTFDVNTSPNDIYIIQNTGSWGAETKILDASGTHSFSVPQIQSTIYPNFGGQHTNIPTAGYQFVYYDTVSTVNIFRFYSSTDIGFPQLATKNYSRGASGSLPASDLSLTSLYSLAEYTKVATEDAIYVSQVAVNQYSIFEFKNKSTYNTDEIHVAWIGKTDIAPSTSTVYLQIYNRNSTTWETLASDSSSSANIPFTLVGAKTTSLSNYYDSGNWISCRVYQLAQ